MLDKKMHYCLKDVSIVPAETSQIDHRGSCWPYREDGNLPIFTSPMLNVIGFNNYIEFEENHIIPILPRTIGIYARCHYARRMWCAFGLGEFRDLFIDGTTFFEIKDYETYYVLIDIANGNMESLYNDIKKCKKMHSNVVIMAGNVANPNTYKHLADAGADYVRLSVGTGSVCTTTSNTGNHYPMASLLQECYAIKKEHNITAKIIADGGIKNYDDIIKCLALGADYVMCGNVFNRMLEADGDIFFKSHIFGNVKISKTLGYWLYKKGCRRLYHEYFGMSTKRAQRAMKVARLHTGEGRTTFNKIEYTMSGWVENFTDYLRSAMSYCNVEKLDDFTPENVNTIVISENSYNSYNR